MRPSASGEFKVNLPVGEYQFRTIGDAYRSWETRVQVVEGENVLDDFSLPAIGQLKLPQGQPMRLVFEGLNGTPPPNFVDTFARSSVLDIDGVRERPEVSNIFMAGAKGDPLEVNLAAGDYRVYATRGPEYSVESTNITMRESTKITLEIDFPKKVIETQGFISADLHVHSGHSFDTTFAPEQRLRTFVAENGEVLIATDHDYPFDYQPLIRNLKIESLITSVVGVELTGIAQTDELPFTSGHSNFFPFNSSPNAYRKGVPNHENMRLREIQSVFRQNNSNGLHQLNHPRTAILLGTDISEPGEYEIDDGAYLEHMGVAAHPYDPNQPLGSEPNHTLVEVDPVTGLRDIDFDLLEVLNPDGDKSGSRLRAVRRDWLSFLLQGEKIVGTANSDSHGGHEQVAVPRNMVAVVNDSVAEFELPQFLAGLRLGNTYGTTGPMIEISLGGKAMGQMVTGKQAKLVIKAFAAEWIPLEEISVQVNGKEVQRLDASTQNDFVLDLNFDRDSLLMIEVFGRATEKYAAVYPKLSPYAFTNPIYIDFNEDAAWDPPGLPSKL